VILWIKNAWYVGCWSGEIEEKNIIGRTILNLPLIFYRDLSGKIIIMEDRCCHRHAPLSKGKLEGEDIRCMYHGLKFDKRGKCIEIPGSDRIPKKMFVRTFPSYEKDNLVWIWLGDPILAKEKDIISCWFLDDDKWSYSKDYLHYQSEYRLIVDNLLDASHLNYVHENSIGSNPKTQAPTEVVMKDFGLHVEDFWNNDEPAPHHKKVGNFNGKVDRWNIYDWYIKGNLLVLDSGSTPAGGQGHEGDRSDAIEFRHLSALTPETNLTTHYFFAHARNFALKDKVIASDISRAVSNAFKEDKDIIEEQQKIINYDPSRKMLSKYSDGPLNWVRKKIEHYITQETGFSTNITNIQ
jgi:phenylpropionate dioxygenase-like ring-hydroxylating dioxygenase large terminal subunit